MIYTTSNSLNTAEAVDIVIPIIEDTNRGDDNRLNTAEAVDIVILMKIN